MFNTPVLDAVDPRWNRLCALIAKKALDPGEVAMLQLVQVRSMLPLSLLLPLRPCMGCSPVLVTPLRSYLLTMPPSCLQTRCARWGSVEWKKAAAKMDATKNPFRLQGRKFSFDMSGATNCWTFLELCNNFRAFCLDTRPAAERGARRLKTVPRTSTVCVCVQAGVLAFCFRICGAILLPSNPSPPPSPTPCLTCICLGFHLAW